MSLLGLLAVLVPVALAPSPRQRLNFDAGWKFQLGDLSLASARECDDRVWLPVELPHDWSISGGYRRENPAGNRGGFLPGGVGWYRKHFAWTAARPGEDVLLEFDGVYRNAEVWINGHRLGRHPYGYTSFAYELGPWLRAGENVVAVRVDDSLQPSARWYAGCGIYRHVWLTRAGPSHFAHWGVTVTTPEVSAARATVNVALRTESGADQGDNLEVELAVENPRGEVVASTRLKSSPSGGFSGKLELLAPELWSPDSPALYRLRCSLQRGGTEVDAIDAPFGLRSFRFDAATGFWLNGSRLKWRGLALHEDGGPLGAAMPAALWESRLRQIKAMGANAVRTAHNPFSPEFLDLCDRLGILVMEEAFDGWHRKAEWDYGATDFARCWQDDLASMVRRDANHPSVVVWSIGNETGREDTVGLTRRLHQLDSTRPVTGGQVLAGVDIAGWNGPGEVPDFTARWSRALPMILTECPHTFQTRGFYRTQTWWRDEDTPHWTVPNLTPTEIFTDDFAPNHPHQVTYNSSYDNAGIRICIRQSLERTRDCDFISGENRWSAFDYLGESFGWPLRMGNFGIIDDCGFPKDAYYLYQSQWTSVPMLHLLPHWTHPTLAARTAVPVWAYTNCESVDLYLNGRFLGNRRIGRRWDQMNAAWSVPYEPGVLRAIGWKNGRQVVEASERTAGPAAQLRLDSDNSELRDDGGDLAQIAVAVEDSSGTLVPAAADRVHFAVVGPARFLGADNGDPADLDNNALPDRRAFHGLCKAFVGAGREAGPVLVAAGAIFRAPGRPVAIDVKWRSLRGAAQAPAADIRYTTDGTEPNLHARSYRSPFAVFSGTPVKAIVLVDGRVVLRMAEKF